MLILQAPLSIVHAAPAPVLTDVIIYDLTFDDETMDIYVQVVEIGTSQNSFVWANNILLKEDVNKSQILWTSSGIGYGFVKYYKIEGVKAIITPEGNVTSTMPNRIYSFKARSQNAINPWNDISTSRQIRMP